MSEHSDPPGMTDLMVTPEAIDEYLADTITLHRFVPVEVYNDETIVGPGDLLHGVFVDTETTGLDTETDKIIQIAIVPFSFSRDGVLCEVGRGAYIAYEDPGTPLSEDIVTLTGITDEMLAGQRIDAEIVYAMVHDAAIVIAHNAEFDRQMCEKRLPIFEGLPWACSQKDIDWLAAGYRLAKLEWLLFVHCRMYIKAHEADTDARAALHLLSTTMPSGQTALAELLERARIPTVRIYADGSPYSERGLLKNRQYHWDAGDKVWWKDVPAGEAAQAEFEWLREHSGCRPHSTHFNARKRFSKRIDR